MEQNLALFRPSGVNTSFHGAGGSFQDYIQNAANLIALGRIDLNSNNTNKIVAANSPFELRPSAPTKKGILLIHGLYDSPYTLRDISNNLVAHNFLVRSILLPGHGTVPGDLLNIDYEEWLKAVAFGIQSLTKDVEEVYLLGYSLGGTLAAYCALQNQAAIKGLILMAPALQPRRRFVDLIIRLHGVGSLFSEAEKWYQIEPQTSFARYESFPYNAAHQARLIMKAVDKLLRQQVFTIPLLVIANEDDESVHHATILRFFQYQKNPLNRLLFYSNNVTQLTDPRITIRKSAVPEKHILNLAHTGLPLPGDNPHYGEKGDFKDFQHYHNDLNAHPGDVYFGAISPANLKKYVIQRLSYNPDFAGMMQYMNEFLKSC